MRARDAASPDTDSVASARGCDVGSEDIFRTNSRRSVAKLCRITLIDGWSALKPSRAHSNNFAVFRAILFAANLPALAATKGFEHRGATLRSVAWAKYVRPIGGGILWAIEGGVLQRIFRRIPGIHVCVDGRVDARILSDSRKRIGVELRNRRAIASEAAA